MHRSRVTRTLTSLVVLALLGLFSSGCSSDESSVCAPGTGVSALGSNGYPPAMPVGLEISKATADGFLLDWTPNTEDDLAGYRVYLYDPNPYRDDSYTCITGLMLVSSEASTYLFSDETMAGTYYFKVAAVDSDGNESMRCSPCCLNFSGSDAEASEKMPEEYAGDGMIPPSGGWEEPVFNPGKELDERE